MGALLLSLPLLALPLRAQEVMPPADAVTNGAPVQPPPEEPPSTRYRRGVASFDYGDCAAAVGALEPIAVPGILDDQEQLVDAYRILGVCYYQGGRTADAVRSLEALLYIDPAYQLDPFRTPPPVSELFEERKALIKKKLDQIEEERRRQEAAQPLGGVIVERERLLRTTPYAAVFLPFGVAQAVNGEGGKAVLIGALQGASLAANLAATITAFSVDVSDGRIGSRPHDDVLQGQIFSVAWISSAVALGAFLGSYGYGVADAWWNRVAEEEVSSTEKHHRVEGDEARKLLRRLGEEE